MKTNLSNSVQLYDTLSKVIKDTGNLPIRTAYKLAKLQKAVENDHDFYVNKLNELIQIYSERGEDGAPLLTEDGNGIRIRKEVLSEFETKVNALWNVEVDAPDIKFSLDELDGLKITVEEAGLLEPFIEE